MQHVPWRLELRRTAPAGILVAKAVDGPVPNRLERLDQHVFPEGNPDVIDDKMADMEIREVKILGLRDGCPVLS